MDKRVMDIEKAKQILNDFTSGLDNDGGGDVYTAIQTVLSHVKAVDEMLAEVVVMEFYNGCIRRDRKSGATTAFSTRTGEWIWDESKQEAREFDSPLDAYRSLKEKTDATKM